MALPWYCPAPPASSQDGELEWTFRWDSPAPGVHPQDLVLRKDCGISFEDEAARMEHDICRVPNLVCSCCSLEEQSRCLSCQHATSFHRCDLHPGRVLWCKGSLHGGTLDYERILFNLHRKGISSTALKLKADEFVDAGLLPLEKAKQTVLVIEGERGKERLSNDAGGTDDSTDAHGRISERMTPAEMEAELEKRVEMMREGGGGDGITDQFRTYQFIIQELEAGRWLRLMVQASAGTGKCTT